MPAITPIFNLQSCTLVLPLQYGKKHKPKDFTNCPSLQEKLYAEVHLFSNLTDYTKYNTNVFAHRTIIGSFPVFLVKAFFNKNNAEDILHTIIRRIIKEDIPEFFNIYLPVSPRVGLTRKFIKDFIIHHKLSRNIQFYLFSKYRNKLCRITE